MVKPNFFIVGAPKSGTSSLYHYLKQHPNVSIPKRVIYYFCYDLTFRTPPLEESVYLNYYADSGSKKAIGDASVFYLLSSGAAQKIKDFNPDAKIIIMLRNPVQMVYSLHGENVTNGDENIENFEQALDAESSRRAGKLIPPDYHSPLEAVFYSSIAKYYEQVLRYKSVFAEDKIHIIFFEDFISDTEKEYRNVLKFLEIEDFSISSFEAKNPSKVVRSKSFRNFLISPPAFIKSTASILLPHHSKRREWMIDKLWNLNIKYATHKPLSDELKQRLLSMYKDDIEKLGDLLNRDLSNWLKV